MRLSVLMHQHEYDKVLSETAFAVSRNSKETDPDTLRYQGVASFYKQNYYHSKMCFEMLAESKGVKANDFLYLAFMQARQNEKEKAISSWCRCLELNKHNKLAGKALNYIRAKGRDLNLAEDPFFDTTVPPPPMFIKYKPIVITIVLLAILLALTPVYIWTFNTIYKNINAHRKLVTRTELDKVQLDDFNPNLISAPKDPEIRYSYNENEIKAKFNRAKQLITENKPVQAQITINEIRLSNASPQTKMKSEILSETFIDVPDYGAFKNEITFEDFVKDKPLYEHVYIMWEGHVTNYSNYNGKITFDLIIGDDETGTTDGIIPVVFRKAVLIENKDKVLAFGKIAYNEDKQIYYIDGIQAIRR